jgi:type IV pilus assembly protein PilM
MLSIDITDKQIKLVRGSLAGTRIKINNVGTRDVPDGAVVNGYVTDVPRVAAEITELINEMRVSADKEVIVCVNSSSILYKELEVPKPKNLKNTAAIEAMIITEMGIASDYNVSYSIVGEGTNAAGIATIKVMATACPQRLVDGYQTLFVQLKLNLKQINISNNCITRLILHTPKLKEVMPFLCIQVDTDFVNINLYENGQVALSRYVKIDPSDYDNNPDYVNIAVFDNLFRMIQFIGQRPGAQPLRQIMFYGVIRDFVALSNSIASFNIPAHVLSMPANIVKYCDVDFSLYANAIGAFYRADPTLEHINLLQSKAVKTKQSANWFPLQVLGVAVVTAGLVLGVRIGVDMYNLSILVRTELVKAEIEDGDFVNRQREMDAAIILRNNFVSYRNNVEISQVLFDFMPRGNLPQIPEQFEAAIVEANRIAVEEQNQEVGSFYVFDDVQWSFYNLNMTIYAADTAAPANLVQALNDLGFFEAIIYTGFVPATAAEAGVNLADFGVGANDSIVKFDLSMRLRGGHTFVESGGVPSRYPGLQLYRHVPQAQP